MCFRTGQSPGFINTRFNNVFQSQKNSIEVRFEDFVLNQETTISRLENFFGKELARIPMRPDSLHKWRDKINPAEFSYLFDAMNYYDYFYE